MEQLLNYYSSYGRDHGRGSAGAAGIDLTCENVNLHKYMIHTGLHVALPSNCFGLVVPRSSTGSKKGLVLRNTVGIIDCDYRGEILLAYDPVALQVNPLTLIGERVAQLVVVPFNPVALDKVNNVIDLGSTDRGAGGFGSTD